MTVSKKNTFIFFIVGIVFFIFGIWLIDSFKKESWFLGAFVGILVGIWSVVVGISMVINFFKLYQAVDVKIDIKDDYLIFEDEKYPLKDAKITVEFPYIDPITRVTLRIERKNKIETVFEDLVFYDRELKELLELIKPYLKHKDILEKIEKKETLILFEDGFALNNRDFYFDEVEYIETTLVSSGTYYLDLKIVLKNGEIISERLTGGSDEYAKAIFLELKYKGVKFISCGEDKKKVLYTILAIDVIVAILIYFDERFWSLGGVMFFINSFYFGRKLDSSYEKKLCKKVKKLFKDIKGIK